MYLWKMEAQAGFPYIFSTEHRHCLYNLPRAILKQSFP